MKQSITLDVDPELAQSWLVARLPALLGGLAGTSLTVLSAPRHDRSAFERADLALRYGYGEWDGFENALICGDRLTVVGSPGLLKARGLERTMHAGTGARAAVARLHEALMDSVARRSGMPAVEPDAVAVFDNAAGLIAAASAGVGVGLARGLARRRRPARRQAGRNHAGRDSDALQPLRGLAP